MAIPTALTVSAVRAVGKPPVDCGPTRNVERFAADLRGQRGRLVCALLREKRDLVLVHAIEFWIGFHEKKVEAEVERMCVEARVVSVDPDVTIQTTVTPR